MLQEVAARIKIATGKPYKWRKRKIKYILFWYLMISATHVGNSCLAHVINLATQALIGTYSQSPYFKPKSPESHVPTCRDEVGLIRAIVVKVCHPWSVDCNVVKDNDWLFLRNARLQNEKRFGGQFNRGPIYASLSSSSSTWRCDGHQHT